MNGADGTIFVFDEQLSVRAELVKGILTRGLRVEAFETANGVLQALESIPPVCVVLFSSPPHTNGLELQHRLRHHGHAPPIIVVASQASLSLCVRAMRCGAIDFLEEPVELDRLLDRIEEALKLCRHNDSSTESAASVRARYQALTPREKEVVALVTRGHSNKQIARRLEISYRTVEIHRRNALRKMDAGNLCELVRMAMHCGL